MRLQLNIRFRDKQHWKMNYGLLQKFFYGIIPPEISGHGGKYPIFSFSNVHMEKEEFFSPGKIYSVIFGSVRKNVTDSLYESLICSIGTSFPFGENAIEIVRVSKLSSDPVYGGKVLKSETPIVLGMDNEIASEYGISKRFDGILYWNKDMGMDFFTKQLSKNLLGKYVFLLESGDIPVLSEFDARLKNPENKFLESGIELFKGYRFKTGALMNYRDVKIAGSKWDFVVSDDVNAVKILRSVIEMGFGEKCSAGFGFIR